MLYSFPVTTTPDTSPFPLGAPLQKRRGVTAADVERTADALVRAGERPTVERIRAKLGGGSPNTIVPLLDAWWKRIGARLDAGPAALHRLPEVVAHVAEALWMHALHAARERVAQERGTETARLERAQRDVEVRSYVLTLREGELEARIRERDHTITRLERQVRELTTRLESLDAARAVRKKKSPPPAKKAEARSVARARRITSRQKGKRTR